MSFGSLEVTSDLSRGSFSGEVTASSLGDKEEVDMANPLVYPIIFPSFTAQDGLMRSVAGQALEAAKYQMSEICEKRAMPQRRTKVLRHPLEAEPLIL